VAELAVSARKRSAADRHIVTLGFVYPDAIDIRTPLPRGLPDSRSPSEPAAANPQPHAPEDERSSVGGQT
jgi:hypothetical protein